MSLSQRAARDMWRNDYFAKFWYMWSLLINNLLLFPAGFSGIIPVGWRGTRLHPEGFVLNCYFKNRFAKEMLRGENRVFQHTQVEAGISNWAHWAIFAHDSSVKTRQFYPRTAKKKSATTWQVHFWCRSQFFPSWPIGLSVSISSTLRKINPAVCSVCCVLFFLSDSITWDSQRQKEQSGTKFSLKVNGKWTSKFPQCF